MKPWIKTGLFFAAWMTVFMTFIAPYISVWVGLEDEVIFDNNIPKIIISAVVYVIAGLIVGYINRNNKKPDKQFENK